MNFFYLINKIKLFNENIQRIRKYQIKIKKRKWSKIFNKTNLKMVFFYLLILKFAQFCFFLISKKNSVVITKKIDC